MSFSKNRYWLPWLFYIIAVVIYVPFNLMEIPFLGIPKRVFTGITLFLIAITVFISLLNILRKYKQALSYILYWFIVGYFIELAMITNGILHYEEDYQVVMGVVPILVGFNWIIMFFGVYTLTTFLSFFIKKTSSQHKLLFQKLLISGSVAVLLGSIMDPVGHNAGFASLETSSSGGWSWFGVSPEYTLYYFVSLPIFFFPIAWWEVFKNAPKPAAFVRVPSYPLYFWWSLIALYVFWAFQKNMEGIKTFGLILLIFNSILLFVGQRKLRHQNN